MDKLFSLWFFFAVYTGARQHVQGNMSPATFPRILTISMLQNFVIFFFEDGISKGWRLLLDHEHTEFGIWVEYQCIENWYCDCERWVVVLHCPSGHFACMMEGRRHWHRSVTWHPQFFVLLHYFVFRCTSSNTSKCSPSKYRQAGWKYEAQPSFFKPK